MSYLLIRENDAKTFKSFLSGNEIQVGVRVGAQANVFNPDDDVYIFYGNHDDSYQAKITRTHRTSPPTGQQSMVMLGLVKR